MECNFLCIDKYIVFLSQKLGEGTFGKVYKGAYLPRRGDPSAMFAVKIIKLPTKSQNQSQMDEKMKEFLESTRQEISILRMLKHENIVQLFDVKQLKDEIFIFMEYCNQKDLKTFILTHEFSFNEVLYYFAQIIKAFEYLQQMNVIHRDVKPENILLHDAIIKIADFGFAATYMRGEEKMFSMVKGTPITMAPQILEGGFVFPSFFYSSLFRRYQV